jgi:hypothetical protein
MDHPFDTRPAVAPIGYGWSMSAAAVEHPDLGNFADATPKQVRAALIPEEQVEFDQAWRAALAAAGESLDLADVFETLDSWRRVAWMTAASGHEAHRQMWRRAAKLYTGEDIPAHEAFSVTKARLGY